MANRFLLTFFIAGSLNISIIVFLFIYDYLQRGRMNSLIVDGVFLVYLLLAAIILAVISGGIASLIPTNNKVVFVIIGVLPILLFLWNYVMGFYR